MNYIFNKYCYMNEYDIHKALINEYVLKQKGDSEHFKRDTTKDKKDIDVIKENHKFLWNDESASTWEEQLAKRYYDKLFKEYCICDLSRYKDNKVALRWRIEQEVVVGKGQFACANKKCSAEDNLRTWEVNFAYQEQNEKKNALVKIRLCEECSEKLNYHTKKREVKRLKRKEERSKKNKETRKQRDRGSSSIDSSEVEDITENHTAAAESTENAVAENPEAPWENLKSQKEKTHEEEIDDYLADLLF